jgi:hypothetical protein
LEIVLDHDPIDNWSNGTTEGTVPGCWFWDEEDGGWSADGCVVNYFDTTYSLSSPTQTVCLCTHLTDFNVKATDFVPTINMISSSDVQRVKSSHIRDNPGPTIAVGALIVVYLVLWPCIRHRDKAVPKITVQSGLARMASRKTKTELEKRHWTGIIKAVLKTMHYRHAWLGIYFCEVGDRSTGVERLTCALSMILGAMATSAFFFGTENNSVSGMIGVVIVSGFFMLPIRIVFLVVFKKALTSEEAAIADAKISKQKPPAIRAENKRWAAPTLRGPKAPLPAVKYTRNHDTKIDLPSDEEESNNDPPIKVVDLLSSDEEESCTSGDNESLVKADDKQPEGKAAGDTVLVIVPKVHPASNLQENAPKDKDAARSTKQNPKRRPRRARDSRREAFSVLQTQKKECRLPYTCRNVAYTLAFAWCCGCSFIVILFGLNFDAAGAMPDAATGRGTA